MKALPKISKAFLLFMLTFVASIFTNGNSSNRFSAAESLVYDITYTGAGPFNVSSFNVESTTDGGDGPYHSAMHIQSIDGNNSGWIGNTTVAPEPISSVLFLSGGAALGIRRFWKKTR
ncbi:MAG: hypothetical protein HZC49_00205 [Nitrospirae bacterium]|nr:hypothetical protein [Nitrospirota bacterium]